MAGVTPQGFVRLRLPEIRTAIIDDLRQRLIDAGLPDDIETTPDTITGLLIDTFAEREAAIWELSEGVYYSMYPASASGVQLDRAASFTGVTRQDAEYSLVQLTMYGTQGTLVSAGAQARNSTTQEVWQTTEDVTISSAAAKHVQIVPTVADSATYTITINGTPYSYTSDATATLPEILAGLVAQFTGTTFNIVNNGAELSIIEDTAVSMAVSLTANMQFSLIGSAVEARSLQKEAVSAPIGSIDTMITLVPGWNDVTNLTDASEGRRVETDAELRARYDLGVYRLGAATLPSFRPNILEDVQGVTAVKVSQNTTNTVDAFGNKPHSVRVVVQGGQQIEIARAIYNVIAAGIDTNGAVSTTLDTEEGQQTILFDRPEPMYIWIDVVVDLLPDSEGQAFPPNGYDLIRESILAYSEQYEIGNDVIYQELYDPIYDIPGIETVALQIYGNTNAASPPDAGDWVTTNIVIGATQLATFDLSRITAS